MQAAQPKAGPTGITLNPDGHDHERDSIII